MDESQSGLGVAVVGMSCRFPGAADYEQFWSELAAGRCAIRSVPSERWSPAGSSNDGPATFDEASMVVGGFIEDIACFDHEFFRISPREAALIDPQQRLLLELSWACLEDAGISPAALDNRRVGVFVGTCNYDYKQLYDRHADEVEGHILTGTANTFLANRVSHFFNWRGPSLAVDTACASSLSALDAALRSLADGSCELALVAGVNLICSPERDLSFRKLGMLSSRGELRTFDAEADGYVRGEGIGVVLLEPLAAAEAAGHLAHGLVRSVASGHGGRARTLTSPNAFAQAQVVSEAIRRAGVEADTITYVEAHGTGTPLGDPIEIHGLHRGFSRVLDEQGRSLADDARIALGSAKPNIGHLEGAAGIAGLIKILLGFRHGQLPPLAKLERQNPRVKLKRRFCLVDSLREWPVLERDGQRIPRRAGVSCFGLGGSNAHAIVEEPRPLAQRELGASDEPLCFPLSARTPEALARLAERLEAYVGDAEEVPLVDIAHTLRRGRATHEHRVAVFATSRAELVEGLHALAAGVEAGRELGKLIGARAPAELDAALEAWLDEGKLDWCERGGAGQLARLPTYPFARIRHWHASLELEQRERGGPGLGPWLDRHDPLGSGDQFTTRLQPSDALIRDHRVAGETWLPGAVMLEMIRGARAWLGHPAPGAIAGFEWLRPVRVDAQPVELRLIIDDACERAQLVSGAGESETVHARARLLAQAPMADPVPADTLEPGEGRNHSEPYRVLAERGLDYGPALQGLADLRVVGDEARATITAAGEARPRGLDPRVVDAMLQLAAFTGAAARGQVPVPAALERVEWLAPLPARGRARARPRTGRGGRPTLDLILYGDGGQPCLVLRGLEVADRGAAAVPADDGRRGPARDYPERAAAGAQPARPSSSSSESFRSSWVCARALARDYPERAAAGAQPARSSSSEPIRSSGVCARALARDCYRPSWAPVELGPPGELGRGAVVLGPASERSAVSSWVGGWDFAPRCVWFDEGAELDVSALDEDLVLVFPLPGSQPAGRRLRAMIGLVSRLAARGDLDREFELRVVTRGAAATGFESSATDIDPEAAGFCAALRCLAYEHPRVRVRAVDLERGAALESATEALFARAGDRREPDEQGRRRTRPELMIVRGGRALRRSLVASAVPGRHPRVSDGAHVLIVGGGHGLGLETAVWLARAHRARLTIVGRRTLDHGLRARLQRITEAGGEWIYAEADVCSREHMSRALALARERFGPVRVAFHSALVLRDRRLASMSPEALDDALAPKLEGSLVLDELLDPDSLELLVFYSSVVSLRGNAGQANYAAGCGFLDAHAARLRLGRPGLDVRVINWGYWSEVGSVATPAHAARMRAAGIEGIEVEVGLERLARFLASPLPNVAVLAATRASLDAFGVDPSREARAHAGPGMARWDTLESELSAIAERQLGAGSFAVAGAGFDELERWALARARRCVDELDGEPSPRFAQLVAALTALADARAGELGEAAGIDPRALARDNPALASHAALLEASVEGLDGVLAGEIDPVELLFSPRTRAHVGGVYRGPLADPYNELVAACVARFVAQLDAGDQALRVLEIGAGTGGTTRSALAGLAAFAGSLEYTFTDISSSFLRAAAERFGDREQLRFAELDITKPIEAQGFSPGTYDLVIAANVLHATPDLDASLSAVAQLLRRGGGLILSEACALQVFTTLSFGLLDGWWLAQDELRRMAHAPLLSPAGWRTLLAELGFDPVAVLGAPASSAAHPRQCVVVAQSPGAYTLPSRAGELEPTSFASADLPKPAGPARAQLRGRIAGLLAGVTGLAVADVDVDRSFSECGVDSLIAVDLVNAIGAAIGVTLQTTILFDHPTVRALADYLADNHGPQVEPEPEPESSAAGDASARAESARRPVAQRSRPPAAVVIRPQQRRSEDATLPERAALVLQRPTQLDALELGSVAPRRPGPGELSISVRAFGLNFGDLLCARGLYPSMPPYPFVPGFELAGVVTALGPGVTRFAVGDEVMAVTGAELGGHATEVTTLVDYVAAKPAQLSFAEASALPVVFATADAALRRAQLGAGERILIQTAAGGVGLLAVQLAKARGAEIIATAGSRHKCEYLLARGVDHVINYREQDFERAVAELSGGAGVDVVLNTLAGDALQKGLACLGPGGRYVEIAMTGLRSARAVDLSVMVDNQSFVAIDLRRAWLREPAEARRALTRLRASVARGEITPTIDRCFGLGELAQAYAHLDRARNIGKVVVSCEREPARAQVVARARPEAIAIVGMSGCYPEAPTLDDYWRNIEAGRCSVREVEPGRWSVVDHFDQDRGRADKTYSKWGAFIDEIDRFDAAFFNISGLEAERIDPQQRLFLEHAYKAFEHAGLSERELAGRSCGVFLGGGTGDYDLRLRRAGLAVEGYDFMGNEASICAARIAYYLDLQGPSMAISTACSSSLVALDAACRSLGHGECELALAGGVFLNTTERFHVLCSQTGMLSPTGRLRPFDRGADGFVPGEGVGAVVLMPLERALAGRFTIHGVVVASGTNQDGKTNGITAPSAASQARLIEQVYARAQIEPGSISYVECHGTGTALGDPIELEALARVHARRASEGAEPCVLGSVKANIGHAVTAAGIASVHKVLLALHHRRLPPLAGFEAPNPRLALDPAQFVIGEGARAWPGEDRRRAAISSFGFSGTNAHVVIEEPPEPSTTSAPVDGWWLVVVSGATPAALRRRAEGLEAWLSAQLAETLHPGDLCATLLGGRTHMRHRAAWVVPDLRALARALAEFGRGEAGSGDARRWVGEAAREPRELDAELGRCWREVLERGPASSELAHTELARAFVEGFDLAWHELLPFGARYRRLALPTYAFERERHWPEATATTITTTPKQASADGELSELISLGPADPWLRDHLIHGRAIVPAALSVELVRRTAQRHGEQVRAALELRWARPLALEGVEQLRVSLVRGPSGRLFAQLGRASEDAPALRMELERGPGCARPASLDLDGLRQRCRRRLSGAACRAELRALGLVHGPVYESLVAVDVGQGEALAQLELSPAARQLTPELADNPSVLDGAWQALVTLFERGPGAGGPVPHALAELRWYAPVPDRCVAHLVASGSGRYDLTLADEHGAPCLLARGLELELPRRLDAPAQLDLESSGRTELIELEPRWVAAPLVRGAPGWPPTPAVLGDDALADALAAGASEVLRAARPAALPPEPLWIWSPAKAAELGEATRRLARALPELAARLEALAGPRRLMVLVDEDDLLTSSLGPALRSLAEERPGLCAQLIHLPATMRAAERARIIAEEYAAAEPRASELRWRGHSRFVLRHELATALDQPARSPWRRDGVYVVTGGAGGIGRALVEHILAVEGTRVAVISRHRAELPAAWRERVEHELVDVSDADALAAALAGLGSRWDRINGVFHLAGVLDDGRLAAKTEGELERALAAKVLGAHNLDVALAREDLDCFVLFSSLAGSFGNAGQASYALANRYLQRFAEQRELRRARGERRGLTRALAWGLWEASGFELDSVTRAQLERDAGLVAMPSQLGFEVVERTLVAPAGVVRAIATGARARILARARASEHAAPERRASLDSRRGAAPEHAAVADYFASFLATMLKVSVERVRTSDSFELLGLDSIIITRLTAELERSFGPLPKTLWFEYQSLTELVAYFVERYPERLRELLADGPADPVSLAGAGAGGGRPRATPREPDARGHDPVSAAHDPVPAAPREQQAEAIAIVGLAARYPGAADYHEFWRNLCAGRDCVGPVPAERWASAAQTPPPREGGFIDAAACFDPLFFNISPREAGLMDPQERCFIEAAWSALEDAGYTRRRIRDAHGRRLGVFVGVMWGEYQLYGVDDPGQARVESSYASIANRVSFVLDARGPSLALDSMCSSSLSSIHLACESIRAGECELAIAGGVNLSLHPDKYRYLEQEHFLAADSRCRSYGAGGSGYVPSEGVGAVLLKPLSRALADGDHIHAQVRASAINHGGRTHGYTVPNPVAQAEVIAAALARAELSPASISYVEGHGTGTALGDPIEVRGLSRAFADVHDRQPRRLGSVKSNIGHAESAAGVAALTKVVLQLSRRTLVPSLHADPPNPNIDFAAGPFEVQRALEPWTPLSLAGVRQPLRAGVSSFGAGGANAHLVVEAAPDRPAPQLADGPALIVLSARTELALGHIIERLLAQLRAEPSLELADVAHTLQRGRERLEQRAAFVVRSREELVARLAELSDLRPRPWLYRNELLSQATTSDADGVIEALAAGDVELAARRWVRATTEPDWPRGSGRMVPLPTYPFARERYWLGAVERSALGRAEPSASPARDDQVAQVAKILAALERGAIDVEQAKLAIELLGGRGAGGNGAKGNGAKGNGAEGEDNGGYPRWAPPPKLDRTRGSSTAIIGGGPWGIALGKCLARSGLEFTIFEAESDFGGVWNFGAGSGRVYEQTHLISSKLNTQFSDAPMPADYPAYPNHRQFLAYLRGIARRFGLYEHARFGAKISAATPAGGRWELACGDGSVHAFDNLVVATGMQREPVWPRYPGSFAGESLHSASYRTAKIFEGKRVLVVGGGNSGCDIAVDATASAARVLHSTRRAYHYMPKFIDGMPTQEWLMKLPREFPEREALWAHVSRVFKLAGFDATDYGLPRPRHRIDEAHPILNSRILYHIGHGDILAKPDIAALDGEQVRFVDGSVEPVDVIVYACGYRVALPFLAPALVPFVGARPDLRLRMLHREHNNLVFVGFLNAAGGFGNVANAVGRFVASYLSARARDSAAYRRLRASARLPDPELSSGHSYVDSARHEFEVDLWAYIKLLNQLGAELQAGSPRPREPAQPTGC